MGSVVNFVSERHKEENVFYGWFDDATQSEPTYSPPIGGPCILCGKMMSVGSDDVRTHNVMFRSAYAKRSYFYRTHRTCADKDHTRTLGDGFILDLIARNGD
jgi:hypothetical protein